METVYLVTANTWDGGYGASIHTFGVYSSEEKAKEVAQKHNGSVNIIEIDKEINKYLGGYVE